MPLCQGLVCARGSEGAEVGTQWSGRTLTRPRMRGVLRPLWHPPPRSFLTKESNSTPPIVGFILRPVYSRKLWTMLPLPTISIPAPQRGQSPPYVQI